MQDGVILGADTRSTAGYTVADKNCEKIHYIAPNIYCCGAGTAADTEAVTGASALSERVVVSMVRVTESLKSCADFFSPVAMVCSELKLHRYATKRESQIASALTLLKSHLFQYQGYVSAALVLGGVDLHGPHLFTVYPHGSTDSLPFATMGSGSLNAMAVFESGYKDDMTKEEAMKLVANAIKAGIFNDLGSGSNVDLCIITKDGAEYLRNYDKPNPRTYVRRQAYTFPPGTTPVLRSKVTPLRDMVTVTEGAESMEVDA